MAQIEYPLKGKDFSYQLNGDEVTIGRDAHADIRLRFDPRVSHIHCRVVHTPDGYVVHDNGSRNGTKVNDKRIRRKGVLLHHGDSIKIGHTVLHFHTDHSPAGILHRIEALLHLKEA